MKRRLTKLEWFLLAIIALGACVNVQRHLKEMITASRGVSFTNNTKVLVRIFRDEERFCVLRPGETWIQGMDLGSHDDGHSFFRFFVHNSVSGSVVFDSMRMFAHPLMRVNTDAVVLESRDGKSQERFPWPDRSVPEPEPVVSTDRKSAPPLPVR